MMRSATVRCRNYPPPRTENEEVIVLQGERIAQLEAALLSLLPGLVLDRRYADADDDTDAMESRIQTVQDALQPTVSETPAEWNGAYCPDGLGKCDRGCKIDCAKAVARDAETPDNPNASVRWICPRCRTVNPIDAIECSGCADDRPPTAKKAGDA